MGMNAFQPGAGAYAAEVLKNTSMGPPWFWSPEKVKPAQVAFSTAHCFAWHKVILVQCSRLTVRAINSTVYQ
jgi:hypothetical protein